MGERSPRRCESPGLPDDAVVRRTAGAVVSRGAETRQNVRNSYYSGR
jgi:hypothetical protein